MITSDLSEPQKLKMRRNYRLQAVIWTVLGVAMLITGFATLARGHRQEWAYLSIAFGIAWFCFAALNWSRSQKC